MSTDIRDSVCLCLASFMEEARELKDEKKFYVDKKALEGILELDCIKYARPWLYSEYREKLSKITF